MTWLKGLTLQVEQSGGSFLSGYKKKIVLHTTEGSNWPNYTGNAPHFTIKWNGKFFDVRQHVPINQAARALKNTAGGVETNRGGAIQVEIIGTCSEGQSKKGIKPFWPAADDEMLRALGNFVKSLASEVGVDPNTYREFMRYPTSYGLSNGIRLSTTTWMNFNGVCGHQHVPENDHGDPGDIDYARALVLSAPKQTTPGKKAVKMFVTYYGSTGARLVTGDRMAAITRLMLEKMVTAGVPLVELTNAEVEILQGQLVAE